MKLNLFYLLVVIFCSCSENNIRYPLNKGKKTFLSNSATRNKILLAEFEPGLYSFYKNEDKLSEILNFMEKEYSIEEFTFSSSIKSNYKSHNLYTYLLFPHI